MAEPVALLAQIRIEEDKLKTFLRRKNTADTSLKNIDFFASLLYSCEHNSGNVFLFHYANESLFIAYWLNFFTEEQILPLKQTLQQLCACKSPGTVDTAFVSDSSGSLLQVLQCSVSGVKDISVNKSVIQKYADSLKAFWDIFWSFSEKNDFPGPAKALRKRNYFYKPLKAAYKRFLKRKEEEEIPGKIKRATRENPFYYAFHNDYFSYDIKVFFRDHFTGAVLELPGADPFTFGLKGFSMDKNRFFQYDLYVDNPTGIVNIFGKRKPEIKAQFVVHPAIDPQTFNYVKERWDTVYWKDKNHVYVMAKEPVLNTQVFRRYFKPVAQADVKSFECLDFQYGKDKNHLFHLDRVLPVNPRKFQLDKNGFLWDDKHVFHYGTQLHVDAKTFQIIETEGNINSFMGDFILQDKNGKYQYSFKTKILQKI